ncbi:MAG TPA: deoxynucleoside kinase [Elusimicrobiota bacterium]|jgi:deoxyadenosine/deoxycytidine kinase|nr:deoxynucleoside kinase [Elusimicrobiota bacterium]
MFAEGYIGIAGTIGVGKSTLTTELAKALNFDPILEEVDGNPYLEHFYKDMRGFGTMMQVWLLNHRFRQHREFVTRISLGRIRGVVQDRTIWEDTIFARMLNRHPDKLISDLDYNTYLDLFDNMVLRELVFPQLMIYLDCKPETAIKRIGLRGRVMEKEISIEYLRMLRDNYEEFIAEMEHAGVRILRLPWENFVPIPEVCRLVHEYSLKPSSFTKWVRPLRRTPKMEPKKAENYAGV